MHQRSNPKSAEYSGEYEHGNSPYEHISQNIISVTNDRFPESEYSDDDESQKEKSPENRWEKQELSLVFPLSKSQKIQTVIDKKYSKDHRKKQSHGDSNPQKPTQFLKMRFWYRNDVFAPYFRKDIGLEFGFHIREDYYWQWNVSRSVRNCFRARFTSVLAVPIGILRMSEMAS